MLIEYRSALKEMLVQGLCFFFGSCPRPSLVSCLLNFTSTLEAEAKDDSSDEDEQKSEDGDSDESDVDSNSSKSSVDTSEENKENEDGKENFREDESKLQEYIRSRK